VWNVRLSEGKELKVPWIIGKWGYILFPETQGTSLNCPRKEEKLLFLDRHLNCAYLCGMIYFTSMRTELIENICFTEVEYNIKTEGEDCASFDGFIDAVLMFVNESGGSLEDAVDMANEAFLGL
jgi:hypothetical protein